MSQGKKNKAVFLDRDGVINNAIIREGKPYPPSGLDGIRINPSVERTLKALHDLGFLLIIATNQPDVSRGRITRESVEEIHAYLRANLPLDLIQVCYHDNQDRCDCRKPEPGLLLQAARKFNIDLTGSYMIGDRWSDVEAGKRAGCQTIYIDSGYSEKKPYNPDFVITSITEVVEIIMGKGKITASAQENDEIIV